ncbi:MAG: metallophosphoesterase family protein [Bacillota bacterium]
MKLLVLTDTHIRGTTPQNRLDDFPLALQDKLLEVQEIAQREDVDLILHAGDMFDRPDTAPSVVSEFVQILRGFDCPIYVVAGNHDLYGQNPTTLPRTMLGLLGASGIVELLNLNQVEIIESDGITLQLEGTPYYYNLDSQEGLTDYLLDKRSNVDYAIKVIHGMLLAQPFSIEMNHTLLDDIKETEADITISGHYHTGFGVEKLAADKYALNPGSLVRIGAYPSELKRQPQVAIIELTADNIDIKLVPLSEAQAGKDVLDRSQIEWNEHRKQKLADFTQDIRGAGEFNFLEVKEILEELASNKDLSTEVKEEARARIAQAEEKLS